MDTDDDGIDLGQLYEGSLDDVKAAWLDASFEERHAWRIHW